MFLYYRVHATKTLCLQYFDMVELNSKLVLLFKVSILRQLDVISIWFFKRTLNH